MKQLGTKPKATLSLDLDNEWSYIKTHGDSGWESFPSYLDVAVPRFLRLFEEIAVKVTVFVVGQDAALEKNHKTLGSISAAGHEIGNHSFSHEPWLHLYSEKEVEMEIQTAEEHIERATGAHPVGFRGPGYSISSTVLRVLARRHYQFDASTLPTFIGPLGRMYYFMTTRLDREQQKQRKVLFGSLKDGLRPIDAYQWGVDGSTMLEIPVTTFPLVRIPFHISYVIYLSRFSPALARLYFRTALLCCRLTGTEPSILVHPLDLLGKEDVGTLNFFPGMDLAADVKLQRVRQYLTDLAQEFEVVPLGEYARGVGGRRALRTRQFSK
jgi:peptidoglycan-N-acetylglucosamine deacetylase